MTTATAETIQPPPWLAELSASAPARPVPLRGTGKQVSWAEGLRKTRLTVARSRGETALLNVLLIIEDSTYYICNKAVPMAELPWPVPEQIARTGRAPTPSACPHCGEPLDGPRSEEAAGRRHA